MAILTTLFSALAKKIGDLLQTVFGWSIAALFGRLSSKKQVLISIALLLSLCWPLFVVGVFLPAAATFIIAFIPIEDMVSESVLRVVWVVMAVITPIIVGILTRVASPELQRKGFVVSVLDGYPLALGYAISFLITLITVPIIKVTTLFRRWEEEHVFVQPKKDRYRDVVQQLCEAEEKAGLSPRVHPVPAAMALSTKVIKLFARGAIDSLIVSHPMVVRAKGIEMYLYPADLLIRGEKKLVAKVRAMMNRTLVERDAYLVQSEEAQHLQDELGRLWEALQRHDPKAEVGDGLKHRLAEISTEATRAEMTFADWVLLDRIAHRVEGALLKVKSIVEAAGVKKTSSDQGEHTPSGKVLPSVPSAANPLMQSDDRSIGELVESALDEGKKLVAIEVAWPPSSAC